MPRAEKGTPKDIANKVKSKGLQKLKFFCQMCSKQCRDANGFKCHLTSESHQRQLLLFADNQNSYLREFSKDFESTFMRILRHTYSTKRIRANEVYQEVIKDKGHVHMNSTVWHTLTGFVQYLGSSGKCKIDQTEKGWYIQYIDQEEEIRRNKILDRAKKEKDEEERNQELLERQINRAKERVVEEEEEAPRELVRENPDEKIKIALPSGGLSKKEPEPILKKSALDDVPSSSKSSSKRSQSSHRSEPPAKKSTLDKLIEEEERYKERKNRQDNWVTEGIVVKILTKKLGKEFHNAKGVITKLVDRYTAMVDVDGDLVKIDQLDLQTVIPSVGRTMLIVNGAYRGYKATLMEINEKSFSLKLKLAEGLRSGRVVDIKYEDASKLA
uniref:C2H2-type domain-containing protein n=1 Tax=Panagrellus redivivus TaxID=6233 RepID=A0A7E4VI60_PANRE